MFTKYDSNHLCYKMAISVFFSQNFEFLFLGRLQFLISMCIPLVHKNCHCYDAKIKFDDSSCDLQKIEDGIFLEIFYF